MMKSHDDTPILKVGLLLHKNQSWSRRILPGLARYARANTTWELTLFGDQPDREALRNYDALIGAFYDDGRGVIRRVRERGLPCVNVSGALPPEDIPRVTHDNFHIGVLAAEHLMGLGLEHFACVTIENLRHTEERFRGFQETLAAAGFDPPLQIYASESKMELKSALRSHPFPLGVFAVNDTRARHFEHYIHNKTSWKIPSDIALIGCDNDFMECELCATPISSIELNYEAVGHEAARILDFMLRGENVPPRTHLPPLEVVRRRSSDYLLHEDRMVRRVLDQLRTRFHEPLNTADLARQQGLTPRHVQRRFKAATGKNLQQTLLEIRLEKARSLLRDTPLSISEIAMETGFTDLNRFPGYFRRRYGCTPRDYRSQLPKP